MKIHFTKYQATGNDFVVIDNRSGAVQLTLPQVRHICDRRLGVGADGLILLENHVDTNFNLIYFNSDGTQSLCGNGSRAAVHLASSLGMIQKRASFEAYDGRHEAEVLEADIIKVRMNDVADIRRHGEDWFLNTGSPHVVRFVPNLSAYSVVSEGRLIRYSDAFKPGGTNVNFVELLAGNALYVRTYERGVEDETLSCGTGVTAAALVASMKGYQSPIAIKTKGGDLSVTFSSRHTGSSTLTDSSLKVVFEDVFLIGPAKMVFEGYLEL